MLSRREIVDSVLSATRQQRSQIGSLVEDYLNITLAEINNPGWAFRNDIHHIWSFLRGKTSISTTDGTESYVLPRRIDHIALMRQTDTPTKIYRITDEEFYRLVPDPSDYSGNPRYYRIWDLEGVKTQLSTADTIDVVSSSTSDAGSSDYTVTVAGYDSNGILVSETYELNGTTTVSGSTTFAAGPIWVSKRDATNGTVTVTENSGSTTLVVVGQEERAPRFKVVYFYPTPSSASTVYIEYYTTIRPLTNDSDVPNMPSKFVWVVRLGVIAKVYGEYLKDESLGPIYESRYRKAVRAMVNSDRTKPDLIEHLQERDNRIQSLSLKRSEDEITA